MKNLELDKYLSPELEIIEVNIEKGYASSLEDDGNLESPDFGGDI